MQPVKPARTKRYCPFCDVSENYLSQCASFAQLTPDQVKSWLIPVGAVPDPTMLPNVI